LKDALGLASGIDENKRRLVPSEEVVEFVDRVMGRMSGPRQALRSVEHRHMRRGPAFGDQKVGKRRSTVSRALRYQVAAQIIRLRDGGRQANAGERGGERKDSCKAKCEQIAALGSHQRMEFIKHDAAERTE